MFDKKYILKNVISKKIKGPWRMDMMEKICYPVYFRRGERGWFLCEMGDINPHRIHTSIVEKVEWDGTNFTVETANTIYKFKQIEN